MLQTQEGKNPSEPTSRVVCNLPCSSTCLSKTSIVFTFGLRSFGYFRHTAWVTRSQQWLKESNNNNYCKTFTLIMEQAYARQGHPTFEACCWLFCAMVENQWNWWSHNSTSHQEKCFLLLKQQHHLVHRINMVNNKNTCTLKTFSIKPFVRKKAMNPHSSLASQFMKLSNLAAH